MLQISGLHKVGHHQGVIGSPTMDVPLAAEAAKVHGGFTGRPLESHGVDGFISVE